MATEELTEFEMELPSPGHRDDVSQGVENRKSHETQMKEQHEWS